MALIPCQKCKISINYTVDICPYCGYKVNPDHVKKTKIQKKGLLITIVISLILACFLAYYSSDTPKTETPDLPTRDQEGTNTPAETTMPDDERAFIRAVQEASTIYDTQPNELKKSAERTARGNAIKEALHGSRTIHAWIGTLTDMRTNSDGNAIIEIQLDGTSIRITTWNNALSDTFDHTLISQQSPLYSSIAGMHKGQRVLFSGNFLPSRESDYVKEKSMTEEGSMHDPEFIFRFESVGANLLARPQSAIENSDAAIHRQQDDADAFKNKERLPPLDKYVGQHPREILKEPAIASKFQSLLLEAESYGIFMPRIDVSSGVELKNGFYVGAGCLAHACGSDEAAFAINRKTGEAYAIMIVDGKQITWYGVKEASSLPAPLLKWFNERNNSSIVAACASQSREGQISPGGSTWKCNEFLCWKTIGSPRVTGKNTKSIWVDIQYKDYPGYYTRSLEEVDCAKGLERESQCSIYTNEGKFVKYSKSNWPTLTELQGKTYKIDGWLPVTKDGPMNGFFDSICHASGNSKEAILPKQNAPQ